METIRLFAFFCEGNELVGKDCVNFLKEMLTEWKKDSRHLYVAASGYPTVEGSDFFRFLWCSSTALAGRSERTF